MHEMDFKSSVKRIAFQLKRFMADSIPTTAHSLRSRQLSPRPIPFLSIHFLENVPTHSQRDPILFPPDQFLREVEEFPAFPTALKCPQVLFDRLQSQNRVQTY